MFKNMKLSAKKTLMGAGIVLALGVLGFIVYYSNSSVKEALKLSDKRSAELEIVQEMRVHQLTLNLVAAEIILDREAGD